MLGDPEALLSLLSKTGMFDVQVTTQEGTMHAPSIELWLYGEIEAWVLASTADDAQWRSLLEDGEQALRPFVTSEGSVSFVVSAHILTASNTL